MEFKGPIAAGVIRATFKADFSNDDPDLLIIGYSNVGGSATTHDRDVTAPGGVASVQLEVSENGTLEVIVATGRANDSGRLTVWSGDQQLHDESILGAAHWVYSVEA